LQSVPLSRQVDRCPRSAAGSVYCRTGYWVTQHGYLGLFSLLVLGIIGVPLPDEAVLIFAGALVNKGDLRLVPTIASAVGGSMCGITLSYGFGRTLGLALLHK
jgi:membrane protein DedA with SNARE-associated domain